MAPGSASTSASAAEGSKENGTWKKMLNLIMQLRKVSMVLVWQGG